MSHPIHRVAWFELLEAYRLRVRFADGAERTIDLEPVLFGAPYGPLRDPVVFGQVRIDPQVRKQVCVTRFLSEWAAQGSNLRPAE